jgi:putative endopeptidase
MTKKNSLTDFYDLDKMLRPQDDFYGYVNNSWLAAHPIPESESRWGTFVQLRDEAWRNLRSIYDELQSKDFAAGSVHQQVRDFYYTGMRMDKFQDTHMELVRSLFADVDGIESSSELSAALGRLHALRISGPWATIIDADNHDSSRHVIRFCQAGLTLPDRDYYLEKNQKIQHVRREYEIHAHKVFSHFPELGKNAKALWEAVYEFEYVLAKVSRTSIELRDVENNYHKIPFAEVKKTYGNIDWAAYASSLGWEPDDKLSIDQPEFMKYVDEQIASRSLDDWKAYLKWRVVMVCYGKVSSELSQLRFEFFGQVLGGTTKIMPTWKRVVLATDSALGEAAGRLYVERHFPESSKKQVLKLVEVMRDAYQARIERLDWMSDKTKAYAKKKLDNIKVLIGYPDEWRDYKSLEIGRNSYLGNSLAAARFEKAYWLKCLHRPTSREDWFMNAQEVNAYHDPNRLVICFPAAILQKPFFDPNAHLAANMGGIGVVIGHELTHGFDDQGCMFDAEGNVRTWQPESERKTFKKKAKVIIDQADHFEVLPGLNLKGGLIVGESIADLGGLEIAFEALQNMLGDDIAKKVDVNMTAEQLFYINYARTECSNIRDEKLREYTLSDPHPASIFRINGMVCHDDDFYRVFNVTKTDMLYLDPGRRAKIW